MTFSFLVTFVTEENVAKKVRFRQARETVELLGCAVMTSIILLQCPSFVRQSNLWNQRLHNQLEKEVDLLEAAEARAVEAHYSSLAQCQVRLAELQVRQFAWSEGLTALLIGFTFWYQTRGTVKVGQIIALLGYVQMFSAALTNLFPWLQQCLRLHDVVHRLRG